MATQDIAGLSETFTVRDTIAIGAFQVIEMKGHYYPGTDIAPLLSKKTGTVTTLSTEETIMNSSMNNQSTRHLIAASRINRSALLGVCLIVLTAILFYGPVLLLLWRELQ
jgi:hypothetical protein